MQEDALLPLVADYFFPFLFKRTDVGYASYINNIDNEYFNM